MGKLHKRRKGYSDEELEEEEVEEGANEEEEAEADMEDEDGEDEDEIDDEGEDGEEDDSEDEDDEEDDSEDEDEIEEDEDEIEDEDDEEEEDEEEERRAYRRRRRIRNQIISYLVIALLAVGIAAGAVSVGRRAASLVSQKKQEAELAKELEEAAKQEENEEDLVIDTPESVEPEPEGDFLAELEALPGAATATQAGNGTQEALSQYAVGGLIYFSQNIKDKEQITEMLANTASMSNYPIFLAVDEEGGDVARVAGSGIEVTEVEDMASIGAGGDTSRALAAGETIGSYLNEIGFNLDFAPVADVTQEGVESALGNRSFGSDPQAVGEMVSNVVNGIEGTGVSACLKHFPGLGSASEDTHEGRVEIGKTVEELRSSDFVPFSVGIEAGADFVMVSHATVPALDGDNVPSSLSGKVITDTLRGELGFEGVVITDALDMTAITEYYTSEEAAVMALEAGADMLLMPEDFEAAYNAVLAAVQDGTISEERINESLNRIYRVKCAGKLDN